MNARNYYCRECFETAGELTPVVEKYVDGEWRLVCAKDPNHKGTIRKATAEYLLKQQELEAREVLLRYPHLEGQKLRRSAEEDIAELFG